MKCPDPDEAPGPRNPRGRAGRFDPKIAAEVLRLFRAGMTLKAIALATGLGERTLHDWRAKGKAGRPGYAAFYRELEDIRDRRRWRAARREQERSRQRWQEFKEGRERWWYGTLGPVAFWARRLDWLLERGHDDAYTCLRADMDSLLLWLVDLYRSNWPPR